MSSTLIPSMKEFPILEFDLDKSAKIEPTRVFARRDDIPARCVLSFYQTAVIDGLLESGKLREIEVSGDNWDPRYTPERASQKEKLFWLAVEACTAL